VQIIIVELKNEIGSLAQLIINSYSLNILEISDVSDNKGSDDSITLKLVSKNILTDEAIFQNFNLADMMHVIRVERANNLTFSSSDDLKINQFNGLLLISDTVSEELFTIIIKTALNFGLSFSSSAVCSNRENSQNCLVIRIVFTGCVTDRMNFQIKLLEIEEQFSVDICFEDQEFKVSDFSLIVFDMDSTLINCEVIDELAREVNMQNEVAQITESAMRGELDFGESLHQRLSLLKGAPSSILSKVLDAIDYNPGAKRLISKLQSLGYKTAIISGGFSFFTEHIKNSLSIDYAFANVLEISNGILTGKIENCPLDGKMKNSLMKKLAVDLNIDLRRVIAVGDGANDIPMISNSGLGIAFRAKPKVSEASKYAIKIGGLDTILYFLGIKDD
tara:strand:+ start:64 stop:1236 length:1173 start_codon:yes stop_codon:yes gene_type:complete